MPEWLQSSVSSGLDLAPVEIAGRLGLAAVAGLVVAAIAHFAHGHRKADAPQLLTTLVLLTVLIAMVTLVIGNSVARAFGLVGALSIVRFRTVVDDTRDTAFVIFAVIVGMAIGAGTLVVPIVGVPLVGLMAIALDRYRRPPAAPHPTHTLVIRLGLGRDAETVLGGVLDRHVAGRSITGASTARQGAAMDITYAVTLAGPDTGLPQLVAELNQIDGVQSVELHRR
jgi:hypothetical protein